MVEDSLFSCLFDKFVTQSYGFAHASSLWQFATFVKVDVYPCGAVRPELRILASLSQKILTPGRAEPQTSPCTDFDDQLD